MLRALLNPYLKIIFDYAFKKILVWLVFIVFVIAYALLSTVMWYGQVQKNANLEIELIQNKSKIDSIKIYQNIWKAENADLRNRIEKMVISVNDLQAKYEKDLLNDAKNTVNANVSDDDALSQFAKRYGVRPERYDNKVRTAPYKGAKRN